MLRSLAISVILVVGGCCLDVTGVAATTADSTATSGGTTGTPSDAGPYVTTLAGNGTWGFRDGTGGPNGTAEFADIEGIAVDSASNVYVSDVNRVRKIDPEGNVTTLAGNGMPGSVDGTGGPNGTAELIDPWGIGVDSSGNVYVADYSAACIRKIDVQGNVTTLAGNPDETPFYADGTGGPNGTARLFDPAGLAVDPSGIVYVVDEGNNRIRRVDTEGNVTTVAGNGVAAHQDGTGGPNGTAEFNTPYGLALDSNGNLYVGDFDNRVRKIDPAGNVTTFAGNGGDLAIDGTGGPEGTAQIGNTTGLGNGGAYPVYVAIGVVFRIDASGNVTIVPGSGSTVDGGLGGGLGANRLAVGPNGDIYVAEPVNFRIQVIHP